MATYSAKPKEVNKKWLVIDAEGVVLGRLATLIAMRLRGKHKATFTPHMDCGDNVIVINAEKVRLTGRKWTEKVYVRHTGLLTNGASDTITNWTGTNAAPTTFTAAGTEAWGYTTEDATLGGGTVDRFTSAGGDKWSGFSDTVNEPVIDNAGATSGTETTRVGHQVAVASTTEAGTYQTTIIYTVASVY